MDETTEKLKSELALVISFGLACLITVPIMLRCSPDGIWFHTTKHLIYRIVYFSSAILMAYWCFKKTKAVTLGDFFASLILIAIGPSSILTILFYAIYARKIK
jgi:hypothetical protein